MRWRWWHHPGNSQCLTGAPPLFFLPPCATIPAIPVSLVLFCPLPRDSLFIAGWPTRVEEASRSRYIFGNESTHTHVWVCVCVCIQIVVPVSSSSISSPATGLFLPQTENSAGIMSFHWDSHSSWTPLLALKTTTQIFVGFTPLAKCEMTLVYVTSPNDC